MNPEDQEIKELIAQLNKLGVPIQLSVEAWDDLQHSIDRDSLRQEITRVLLDELRSTKTAIYDRAMKGI